MHREKTLKYSQSWQHMTVDGQEVEVTLDGYVLERPKNPFSRRPLPIYNIVVDGPADLIGRVFLSDEFSSDMTEVTDHETLKQFWSAVVFDYMINEARVAEAERLAQINHGGDANAVTMYLCHMTYRDGEVDEQPSLEDGIAFYQVGRNASHQFYMGMKDGKLYRRSVGEEYVGPRPDTDDRDDLADIDDGCEVRSHVSVVDSWQGYFGHL